MKEFIKHLWLFSFLKSAILTLSNKQEGNSAISSTMGRYWSVIVAQIPMNDQPQFEPINFLKCEARWWYRMLKYMHPEFDPEH